MGREKEEEGNTASSHVKLTEKAIFTKVNLSENHLHFIFTMAASTSTSADLITVLDEVTFQEQVSNLSVSEPAGRSSR